MTAETPQYSRSEISDESKRKSTVETIRKENGWVDKTKTPEGKKELSQKWLEKAKLGEWGKSRIYAELSRITGTDISAESTPEEFNAAVQAWQKEHGLKDDGILGWKTLEKMDDAITQEKNKDDEWNSDGSRTGTGLEETEKDYLLTKKEEENIQKKEDDKSYYAGLESEMNSDDRAVTDNLFDADGQHLTVVENSTGDKYLQRDSDGKILDFKTGEFETTDARNRRLTQEKVRMLEDETSPEYKANLNRILAENDVSGLLPAWVYLNSDENVLTKTWERDMGWNPKNSQWEHITYDNQGTMILAGDLSDKAWKRIQRSDSLTEEYIRNGNDFISRQESEEKIKYIQDGKEIGFLELPQNIQDIEASRPMLEAEAIEGSEDFYKSPYPPHGILEVPDAYPGDIRLDLSSNKLIKIPAKQI